jgi:hypothetical protein
VLGAGGVRLFGSCEVMQWFSGFFEKVFQSLINSSGGFVLDGVVFG